MALFGAKKRLGEQLVDAGLLTPDKLELALQEQQTTKARLGETLIAMGFMTAESFSKFFSTTMGIPTASADDLKHFDPKAVEVVGDDLVRKHQILPYAFDPDNINAIHVAMAEPNNLSIIDDIEMSSGMEVIPHYSPQSELAISRACVRGHPISILNLLRKACASGAASTVCCRSMRSIRPPCWQL